MYQQQRLSPWSGPMPVAPMTPSWTADFAMRCTSAGVVQRCLHRAAMMKYLKYQLDKYSNTPGAYITYFRAQSKALNINDHTILELILLHLVTSHGIRELLNCRLVSRIFRATIFTKPHLQRASWFQVNHPTMHTRLPFHRLHDPHSVDPLIVYLREEFDLFFQFRPSQSQWKILFAPQEEKSPLSNSNVVQQHKGGAGNKMSLAQRYRLTVDQCSWRRMVVVRSEERMRWVVSYYARGSYYEVDLGFREAPTFGEVMGAVLNLEKRSGKYFAF